MTQFAFQFLDGTPVWIFTPWRRYDRLRISFIFKSLLHSDQYALHLLQYSKLLVLSPQSIYVLIVSVRKDEDFGYIRGVFDTDTTGVLVM